MCAERKGENWPRRGKERKSGWSLGIARPADSLESCKSLISHGQQEKKEEKGGDKMKKGRRGGEEPVLHLIHQIL